MCAALVQNAALRLGPPPAPPKKACAAFVRAIGRQLTDVLLGKVRDTPFPAHPIGL